MHISSNSLVFGSERVAIHPTQGVLLAAQPSTHTWFVICIWLRGFSVAHSSSKVVIWDFVAIWG